MSTDGCSAWSIVNKEFSDGACLARDPGNSNIVYAGAANYDRSTSQYSIAVVKSTDGGASWPDHSFPWTGDRNSYCKAIAVAPGNPAIVYAGGRRSGEPTIHRSADAAGTWEDVTNNLAGLFSTDCAVLAIWISPHDPDAVAVGTTHGIFTSVVEGQSQTRVWNMTAIDYSTLGFAYDRPTGTLYAATSRGVLSSQDEGATWHQVNDGLRCLESKCIDIDTPSRLLYVGTDGGSVWRRRLPEAPSYEYFEIVDDFESYTDREQQDEAIWQTWIDGFDVPSNGSQVGYLLPPYAEQTIIHGGAQSMPYHYDNNQKYSEATMTLDSPRNWTMYKVESLSLWFRGDAANAAEPMYVAVAGTRQSPAVVYHEDPAAAQTGDWTQWLIDLSEFADQGVDLTDVDRLSLGFGDKHNPQAGGSGLVFFDDIWLYRPAEQTE
ncbi:MAG: WD40/YVTN/BNR-like repeat-containing protein [Planctomycetota bacterium]|jgi:hypothetical protein